jgi:hypothetical protein
MKKNLLFHCAAGCFQIRMWHFRLFVLLSIGAGLCMFCKTSSAQLPEIHRFQKFELNVNPVTDINDTFIRNLALRHYHDWANKALPEIFGMEDPELAAHQDYIDYLELLDLLREEERLPVELTGEEIETLMTIASNEQSYASAWARTLLTLSNTGYLYQEPIIIEQEYMPRKGKVSSSNQKSKPTIRVYPNPSKHFVNIDLSENIIFEHDLLIVTDSKGNEVHRVDLTSRQEGYVMNVQPLKTGIYVVTLWQRGSPVATTKINKQ